MKNRLLYTLWLVMLAVVGCSKIEVPEGGELEVSDTPISFTPEELTADWETKLPTRGVAVTDINTASEIMVYAFLTEPGSVTVPYINHQAATMDEVSKIWSFDPAYYYPLNKTLDFLAYAPQASEDNGITQTLNFTQKSVAVNYETPLVGRNHPDLMLAMPQTQKSSNTQLGELEFKHALTQVSMSAKVGDNTPEGRYIITRFTIHDITTGADYTYGLSDTGIGSWRDVNHGDFIVSAMLPDPEIEGEAQVKLTKKYQSIMSNGHTLFMIPQAIEDKVGDKSTIQITIEDTQKADDGSTLVYRTQRLNLPSPSGAGWIAGQHVNLQFEFDVDDKNVVIPMSLMARLTPWVEQTVDKEIDANIYAFLSDEVISSSTNQVTLFTNGEVTEIKVSGSISGAALGEKNESVQSYPITINTNGTGAGEIQVVIKNSHGKTITKSFILTVE